jgi:hypothetical protein
MKIKKVKNLERTESRPDQAVLAGIFWLFRIQAMTHLFRIESLAYARARLRLSMASSISCVLLKPTVTQSTPAF